MRGVAEARPTGARVPRVRSSAEAVAKEKTRATPTARKAAEQNDVDLKVKGSGDAGRVMRRDVEQASDGQASAAGAAGAEARDSRPPSNARAPAVAPRRPRRRADRRAGPHVEAARDDRQAAHRGAEHRGDADHLQRGGHVGRAGAARAAQGDVQGALRHQPRHDVLLRQGRHRRAARLPPDQRRDPGGRDGPQALLRHRHRGRRERGPRRAGASRRGPSCRSPRSKRRSAISRSAPKTARCRSPTSRAAPSPSPTAASSARSRARRSSIRRRSGILGLHAIKDRPVGVNGQVVIRPMMYTALTYDHRIVDGSEAVRFLVRVKELVEDPARCCWSNDAVNEIIASSINSNASTPVIRGTGRRCPPILDGVTHAQAAAKPIAAAHSIWELVLHIAAWKNEVRRRLSGAPAGEPREGDWPSLGETSGRVARSARASRAGAPPAGVSSEAIPGAKLFAPTNDTATARSRRATTNCSTASSSTTATTPARSRSAEEGSPSE